MSAGGVNIATALRVQAGRQPERRAVVAPAGRDARGRRAYAAYTFRQLDEVSDRLARGLRAHGVGRGTKTALMVPPGLDFAAATFALFKVGAVVVMIDPGMGLRNLGRCLAEAGPEAFVGSTLAHVARVLLRWAPATLRRLVTLGPRLLWGGARFEDLERAGASADGPLEPELFAPDELAAILYTSGSTGVAKGAVYTHGIFLAQVAFLAETFGFGPDEVDLATFPLFALFDPALGITAVIPDMDASRPARADPRLLVEALQDQGCTQMFGSPALIDNLSRFGVERGLRLPALRRVISAGAPARPAVLERFHRMLGPEAQIFTPYGATEALPVSCIGSREILGETRAVTDSGGGTCVGAPSPHVKVAILRVSDEPIARWSDDLLAPPGTVGEIAVRGPVVTREYFNRPDATALHKVDAGDGTGAVWHRVGDVGRLDEQGRLWFCGRKSHRVVTAAGTLYTIPCEAVFNRHPRVFRSALVGVGQKGAQRPVVCLELEDRGRGVDPAALRRELLELGRAHEHTRGLATFLVHPAFPVDVRHNAKIGREQLALWAAGELARGAQAALAGEGEPCGARS